MPRRVRVKMCGMTREEDIAQAVALGADAIGLIFYPGSSRCISVSDAKRLLRQAPLFVDVVAVLVNQTQALIDQIINELPVTCLQFHGDETPDFCRQFAKPYIKSVAASSTQAIHNAVMSYTEATGILLETPSTQHRGGSGTVFDWSVIPAPTTKPFILAGGLKPENIAAAVATVSPYAVDVCSGIERSPGIKDHTKMARFINALEGNDHEQDTTP